MLSFLFQKSFVRRKIAIFFFGSKREIPKNKASLFSIFWVCLISPELNLMIIRKIKVIHRVGFLIDSSIICVNLIKIKKDFTNFLTIYLKYFQQMLAKINFRKTKNAICNVICVTFVAKSNMSTPPESIYGGFWRIRERTHAHTKIDDVIKKSENRENQKIGKIRKSGKSENREIGKIRKIDDVIKKIRKSMTSSKNQKIGF